jgi:hypothetical protein
MTVLARASSNCKRHTRPLAREGAPVQEIRNCLMPKHTDRLILGRNIILSLKVGG